MPKLPRINQEHDPEKHALGLRPDGWVSVFPRDKREAFARRSCSNRKLEWDDDSKKSHHAPNRLRIISAGRRGTPISRPTTRLRQPKFFQFFRDGVPPFRRADRAAAVRREFRRAASGDADRRPGRRPRKAAAPANIPDREIR